MSEQQKMENVPQHLAVILDGNGRWAKAKGLPRNAGHVEGAKVVEDMCEIVWNKGIRYFTVYAFSTENWNRPEEEVSALMGLLRNYLKTAEKRAMKNNMRIRVIGDRTRLASDLQSAIEHLESVTDANTGLHFQIAINYGGRDEIVRACNRILQESAADLKNGAGEIPPVTEQRLSDALDTAHLPDPDLLIRTCGEQRISNFLLWQLAYTELYFCDKPWPDFDERELDLALEAYGRRERRFGGLKS
ncbi:MAG: di-trans,poly-cis-decaprenylcistransferase [Lachnospiraceae bacterium]|nr:di-trans,poly-cis-decaprenylcistransferase [Lachnospiraceae bacterium]